MLSIATPLLVWMPALPAAPFRRPGPLPQAVGQLDQSGRTPSGERPATLLGRTDGGQDVGLFYYRPTVLHPDELIENLAPLHGRVTEYVDPTTGDGRSVENLRSFGDLLVVVETLDRIQVVLDTLQSFEEMSETEEPAWPAETVATLQYAPRFSPLENLRAALVPYERQVLQGNQWISSITPTRDGTRLLVRDTPETLDEIRALLEDLDRPAPQILMTARVLAGGGEGQAKLPAQLAQALGELLPYDGYSERSLGLVRAAVQPGTELRLDLDALTTSFALRLRVAAYDQRTGAVTFDQVVFEEHGDLRFSTATTIESGRYTVLGAAGNPPLFVVLHAAAMQAGTGGRPGERSSGAR